MAKTKTRKKKEPQTRFSSRKTVTRKTRFTKNDNSGGTHTGGTKAKPAAEKPGKTATKTSRRKGARNWTSEAQVEAAKRLGGGRAQDGKAGNNTNPGDAEEFARRALVRQRNRRRRLPWMVGFRAALLGLVAHVLGLLVAGVLDSNPAIVAGAFTVVPACGTAVAAFGARKENRQWLPEIGLAGVGSCALVFWIGVAGLSWTTLLVYLLGTLIIGSRWWKANPIGPGVPPLDVPKPAPPPPAAPVEPPKPEVETDEIAIAWRKKNAEGEGKAKGSRLTHRTETEFTVNYVVELNRGVQTVEDLLANRGKLAGGLGLPARKVIFKRPLGDDGEHLARMTIVTRDPVAEVRFFTGPRVVDGTIKGLARFIDGSGEADITMWDDGGTVPTMVVGSTGGGKSGAANCLVCAAMSTGVLNLLYADPKGNSSTALAKRARVSIIGKQNVLKLPYLVLALLEARSKLAAELDEDQLFPTVDVPGWMFLHDEYSLIANDPLAQRVWTECVNIIRALGIWGVALNQSQGQPQWGSDHARSAWASQVVAFRVNSKSGSDLVPGLNFDPNELPVDERGRPVPGMAVHAHFDTPTRWDFLPSESNAKKMAARGLPAPPFTTTKAFDEFFNQPPVGFLDALAITSVLGPPKHGRWQVGGNGATHEFPTNLGQAVIPTEAQKPRGRWGQRGKTPGDESQLSPGQKEILALVRGGTTATGEIVEAAHVARSTAMEALDVLVELGFIRKTERGVYEAVATPVAAQ
ncbi:helix-turn-helix domain-containing protein [Actinophytocola sp.]|uniref:helix-turn-helix domain-containing protein n=1 Tax=Actinophytocola sp. TaxID=1872138 RepID=UPI002ED3A5F1